MSTTDQTLPLRIVVVDPPSGVVFALQRGRSELESPTVAAGEESTFALSVRVGPRSDPSPNFLGPFAQGPKGGRFVYVNAGTLAGQADSCWTRRAKVSLEGITWALVDEALAGPGKVLEARLAGTGRDGGPACATVPLLGGGWRVAAAG
jgi:hypothetical protein